MDLEHLLPGIIGAIVGVFGWLLVGLYIQRRQFLRQARNAARAVYFELEVNRLHVKIAAEYGTFVPLGRSMFDRLLPELATWLNDADLQTVVTAYMGHIGYEQARSEPDLPAEIRQEVLAGVLGEQEAAIGLLGRRLFSPNHVPRFGQSDPLLAESGTTSGGTDSDSGR